MAGFSRSQTFEGRIIENKLYLIPKNLSQKVLVTQLPRCCFNIQYSNRITNNMIRNFYSLCHEQSTTAAKQLQLSGQLPCAATRLAVVREPSGNALMWTGAVHFMVDCVRRVDDGPSAHCKGQILVKVVHCTRLSNSQTEISAILPFF